MIFSFSQAFQFLTLQKVVLSSLLNQVLISSRNSVFAPELGTLWMYEIMRRVGGGIARNAVSSLYGQCDPGGRTQLRFKIEVAGRLYSTARDIGNSHASQRVY